MTDEEREQANLDDEESADLPTRIDAKAIVFDPELLAPPLIDEMRIGVADLDEDLRTMTQNNAEVARWRRLSTRGLERPASTNPPDDEPITEEQEIPDVTDIQMRPVTRDAYRPPPMRPSSEEEPSLEPSFVPTRETSKLSTTSPGVIRSETTPLPQAPTYASRSFGAPRDIPRSSDVPSVDDLSISAERTAPFQALESELLARVSSAPPSAGDWLSNPKPVSQPAPGFPSSRPSQRPSARPVFVPKPAPLPSDADISAARRELTPTQFLRSPLFEARDVPERAEVAGVPQSYVVAALLVFAMLIVLSAWWVVH